MNFWRPFWIVLWKELRDSLRDRRVGASALILPLLGPVVFIAIFSRMAEKQHTDEALTVMVVGAQNAPGIVDFFRRQGTRLESAPPDVEAKVRDGEIDFAIRIPEGYAADFEEGRSARIELITDSSLDKGRAGVKQINTLLTSYGEGLAMRRLLARGISPSLAKPLRVEQIDLATPEKHAGRLFAMIPLFLVISAFAGGMHVATDTTAGERERGSLESLLFNPVSRTTILIGKWAATCITAWIATMVSLLGFVVAVHRVPTQDLGLRLSLGGPELLSLIAVMLPLALTAASLQIWISLYARTIKEAQTYLQFLMLLPSMPAFFLMVAPMKTQTWMMSLPILGQNLLATRVIRGEGIPLNATLAAGATSLVLSLLLLASAARLLNDERTIYGRSK